MANVLCLRPKEDFLNVGVVPPTDLTIRYLDPQDTRIGGLIKSADALVLPAVGPALATDMFRGSSVRLVQITGSGVDRLDIDALAQLGIPVANIRGGSSSAVAEYVITTASALLRFLPDSSEAIRSGDYAGLRMRIVEWGLNQLEGLTVGIVGFGRIGRTVASRCRAFGAEVVFFDPAERDDDPTVRCKDMDALLTASDIVTLHVPLTQETRGLIGPRELGRMKPNGILINAARGGVVDEAALVDALEARRIGGAAVDTFSIEPPEPDNPLLRLSTRAASRLILTPHIAGVTRQSWSRLFAKAWNNVRQVLISGEPPQYVVNGQNALFSGCLR